MQEWLAVTLAGAAGGVANAIQAGNLKIPWLSHTKGKTPEIDPGLVRNVVVGIVTGLTLWGFNNKDANFDSQIHLFQPVLGALIAGFGGGKALTTALEQPKRDEVANTALTAAENSAEAAAIVLEGGG